MTNKDDIKSWGSGGLFSNRNLGSLLLMLTTPLFCLTFWYICAKHDGSFTKFGAYVAEKGVMQYLVEAWPSPFNPKVWKIILSYMAFQLALMKIVPGKVFKATVTPTGHVPVYNANGFQSYVLTIATVIAGAQTGLFNPAEVYDHYGEFLSSMNLFAIVLCAFLTVKGLHFPSTKDAGSNGNLIVDFFWGTELYPRILGWDIKQFTNCRFGMMWWQVSLICYAYKQAELNGGSVTSSLLVSVLVQSAYIAKFFLWETGYFCTMDIQHDRAGYYICWGCLVWVPSMYTMHTLYMVEHPVLLSVPVAAFMLFAGWLNVWINYDCDRQRQEFRATGGRVKVWGKEPEYVVAKYTTKDGEERSNLLLVSGWWGLARHFHYVPEILASFFWCFPALYEHPLPYFYPVYLTLLLLDRAYRDDKRCADKYHASWDEYCGKVPYKIIPGIL